MSMNDVNVIQDQALSAFGRVPQNEAAAWAQVIAQCEIAYQLARIAEKVEEVTGTEENDLIRRIAIAIESLNPGR